jgi:serine/threonine-protein kinase
VTTAGTTLGTIAYPSPEQALGGEVDHRTDIFSLGIVLFEMLTGRLPFAGATATAVSQQIVQATAPPPTAVNRSIPPELDVIAGRALAISLTSRYETAATMAAELRSVAAILDVRSQASEAAGVVSASAARRRAVFGWLVVLLLLAAIAAVAWFERAPLQRLWRRTLGPAPAPVIAVVPFDTNPSQTFSAAGLAEDLISRLGQTPGLKVIGRSARRTRANARSRGPRSPVCRTRRCADICSVRIQPDRRAFRFG